MRIIHRIGFLIGVACAALVDRIQGRAMAFNETAAPIIAPAPESVPAQTLTDQAGQPVVTAPPVTVGLPEGLDAKKVIERKTALIRAGTEPLIAEKLAIDAESQQALRDKGLKAEVKVAEVPVTAPVPVVHTSPDGSTTNLSDMKVSELIEFAEKNNIDLGDATKKADIIAVIQKGGE